MSKSRLPLWKRILRFTAFALVAIVTVAVLALSWISFQGRREWAAVRQELLAKGEKLTRVELAPPPIPDSENFFADPIWRPAETAPGAAPNTKTPFEFLDTPLSPGERAEFRRLFPNAKGRMDSESRTSAATYLCREILPKLSPAAREPACDFLLRLLAPFQPLRAKIESLLERPGARYPLDYAGWRWKSNPYPGLYDISSVLASFALIHLYRNETADAARLVQDLLRLSDTLAKDPVLLAQMIRGGVLARAYRVITAGLKAYLWSDTDLATLQQALGKVDPMPGAALAFRGERGNTNQVFESLHRSDSTSREILKDSGGLSHFWGVGPIIFPFYIAIFGPGDQAAMNRVVQKRVETADQMPLRGYRGFDYRSTESLAEYPNQFTHFFAANFVRNLLGYLDVTAMQVTDLRQAMVVCGLQRYRLAHGSYPDTLSALAPEFLPSMPRDIFSTQPFHYRLESPDKFRLWSTGPDPGANNPNDDIVWDRG